ncbi:MAG TPA: DNA methyltransferase [Bacteroidota bacterium]|nr:DNA methyltransferase [Bacteroidota bacterium]
MNSAAIKKATIPTVLTPPAVVEGEFWTSKQRQASSLHEISYRACFKPQLPRYFIERYSEKGDVVYDPFMGRGTTIIEAALLGRNVIGNDVNPLSRILAEPRLDIPEINEVEARLAKIPFSHRERASLNLAMFFERKTESEIVSLQKYLAARKKEGTEDKIDKWIRMVATNRLTGHSSGFFSVYTLPPNQATLPNNQKRINRLRKQRPEYRNITKIILKKTRALLNRLPSEERRNLQSVKAQAKFFSCDARDVNGIADGSVGLSVTSPPFLNIVQYSHDNWLRCWFNGIDENTVALHVTMSKSVDEWCDVMLGVFKELFRTTKPGGHVAFEVGEVRNGTINLDEHVMPLGRAAGFLCESVFINKQQFTKTANIWGIQNNKLGTNTNRIVLFKKTKM